MPTRKVRRQADLTCLDCEYEFQGWARYTLHYVEESSGPTNETFDRVESRCPNSPTHGVTLRSD
jgi:hypothetical protein